MARWLFPRVSEVKLCPTGTKAGTPSKQPRAPGTVTISLSPQPSRAHPTNPPSPSHCSSIPAAAAPCSLTPARPPPSLSHQHSHPGHCLRVHGYTWLLVCRTIHPFQAKGNFPNTPLGPRHCMHVKAPHHGSLPAA